MVSERLVRAYRSVVFQIVLLGIVSFSQPGIWIALNNLGAGGQAKPFLVNASNALTYGLMVVLSPLGGPLVNRIGAKWTLFLGVIFYTPYASSLYCNSRFGIEWYMLFGAALCGVGASLLWPAEGVVVVGYPAPEQRGAMIGLWTFCRDLGPLIGGAISLSLNVKSSGAGAVSYNTYLALIGLQCIGVPATLLLSPQRKVLRSDGSQPSFGRERNVCLKDELRGLWTVAKRATLLLLMPLYIVGLFGQTYQYNFLAKHFSVRSRALSSLLSAVAAISADVIMGFLADSKVFGRTPRTRAVTIWVILVVSLTGLYIWQMVLEASFAGEEITLDWGDEHKARFNMNMAVYILWKFFFGICYNYQFYLVGVYNYGPGELPRVMGLLRSFEAVGSTFAYVVGATHWPNLNQGILSFALWVSCIIPTCLALRLVPTELERTAGTSTGTEKAAAAAVLATVPALGGSEVASGEEISESKSVSSSTAA